MCVYIYIYNVCIYYVYVYARLLITLTWRRHTLQTDLHARASRASLAIDASRSFAIDRARASRAKTSFSQKIVFRIGTTIVDLASLSDLAHAAFARRAFLLPFALSFLLFAESSERLSLSQRIGRAKQRRIFDHFRQQTASSTSRYSKNNAPYALLALSSEF